MNVVPRSRLLFEHQNVEPASGKLPGTSQAGKAGAHNNNVVIHSRPVRVLDFTARYIGRLNYPPPTRSLRTGTRPSVSNAKGTDRLSGSHMSAWV